VTLSIKVVPRAARTEIAGTMEDGSLKVRVAAVPEGGKANEELRRFLAGHFGVARDQVEIVAGAAGQRKTVRISG
jgi:hypothetical protein